MFDYLRRHQKWMMIFITIIIVISFTLFTAQTPSAGGPGQTSGVIINGVFRTNELLLRDSKLARIIGQLSYQNVGLSLLSQLLTQPQPDLFPSDDPNQNGMPTTEEGFAQLIGVNYRVIQANLKELGLEASDKAVADFSKTLPVFQIPAAKENLLASWDNDGFRDADIAELLRIGAEVQMLDRLLRSNMVPSEFETDFVRRIQHTGFSGQVVRFNSANYLKPEAVLPAEIKAEYDKIVAEGPVNEGEFTVPAKRCVSYVLIPSPTIPDTLSEEEKLAKSQAYETEVSQLYLKLANPQFDKTLAEAVAPLKLTVTTTPIFDSNSPPKEFVELGDTESIMSEIFATDEKDAVGNPVHTAKGYVLFEVDNEKTENMRVKTLKESTPAIRDGLAKLKASQAALKAAGDSAGAWKSMIKNGKADIEKAAEALKAKVAVADKVMLMKLPSELSDASVLIREILHTPAGRFTKPALSRDGTVAMMVFVEAKQVFKDPLATDNAASNQLLLSNEIVRFALQDWLDKISDNAKLRWK